VKTTETKLAEQIATATEDHWFNPAVIGRLLADQPIYTLDRIMEMVAQIIRAQEIRHDVEWEHGRTSEGLFLAKELNKTLKSVAKKYKLEHIKLPK
jgi:Mg2+/Co2+ transporter CorC